MSTSATPTTPVAWIPSQTWLQKHERIVIAFLILCLGVYGFNRWTEKSVNDAKTQQAIAQQYQVQQDKTTAVMQAALQQQAAQQAQHDAETKQEIVALMAAISARDAATQTKVVEVQQPKTPTQAVTELEAAYTLPAPVTVTDAGAVVPTADIQQFTVAKIEHDAFVLDFKDTKSQLTSCQAEVTGDEGLIAGYQKQVAQDQIDLKAHDDKAAADLKTAKAEARRGKWHTFWAGFVSGFLGRQIIKTETGQ